VVFQSDGLHATQRSVLQQHRLRCHAGTGAFRCDRHRDAAGCRRSESDALVTYPLVLDQL
jgi:hypothetical protein